MASTKVVNRTEEALVLRVGNQNCFAKLGTIEAGGEHKVEIDVNWTYREFALQPVRAGGSKNNLVVSSDDCCDFERLTVTQSGGKFEVDKVARGQYFSNVVPPAGVPLAIRNWRSFFTWPPKFNWKLRM
jgi:hypothetical protein